MIIWYLNSYAGNKRGYMVDFPAGRTYYWLNWDTPRCVEWSGPDSGSDWVVIGTGKDDDQAKAIAQSHRSGLTMKHYTNCPVCEKPVTKTDEETIEQVLIRFKIDCPCGLFSDHFTDGVRHERIGAVVFFTTWQDETPRKWENKDAVIAETKLILAEGPSYPGFDLNVGTGVLAMGAADWFMERDWTYPLNLGNEDLTGWETRGCGVRERLALNDDMAPPEGTEAK